MIKDELIHTHMLLVEVVDHFEEDRDVEIELENHSEVDVGECEFFTNKTKHLKAVQALGDDIYDDLCDFNPQTSETQQEVAEQPS